MRTLDVDGNEITDPDLTLGYLKDDKVFVKHHEEIPERLPVKEIDYKNPIVEHNNGGKIVQVVTVSEYQPHVEAWDEYEDVKRYILYTTEELEAIAAQKAAEEAARLEAERLAAEEQTRIAHEQLVQEQIQTLATFSVMAMTLDEEQAMQVSELFPEWTINTQYKIGDYRKYNGNLYVCLQDNTSQEVYPPDTYISGWKKVGEPNDAGIMPWVQPLGATDAYMARAVVTHKGKTWVSDIDNNVWEPGVYGWHEQTNHR